MLVWFNCGLLSIFLLPQLTDRARITSLSVILWLHIKQKVTSQQLGDVEMPQTCYAFRIPSGAVQAIGPLIIGSLEVSPLPIVAVGSTMNDVPITSTPGRRSTCCTMRDLTRPCTVLVMNGELIRRKTTSSFRIFTVHSFTKKFKLNLLERSQCESKPNQ
jgi:hypothetical protein